MQNVLTFVCFFCFFVFLFFNYKWIESLCFLNIEYVVVVCFVLFCFVQPGCFITFLNPYEIDIEYILNPLWVRVVCLFVCFFDQSLLDLSEVMFGFVLNTFVPCLSVLSLLNPCENDYEYIFNPLASVTAHHWDVFSYVVIVFAGVFIMNLTSDEIEWKFTFFKLNYLLLFLV